jgi:hypothetical protein
MPPLHFILTRVGIDGSADSMEIAERATDEHDAEQMKQTSDVRCQRSEIRDQRSEVRDQMSDVRGQKSEDGRQRAEGGRLRAVL